MGNCTPCCYGTRFDSKTDVLHVITAVFNPAGFSTRVELYKKFAAEMARQPNVVLWTVECLFPGQTEYTVTTDDDPHHLQLRGKDRIWVKENLINIAVQRCLPRDWKYMAWVDGDLLFHDKHIAEKTINALQEHPVVQMWETVKFLGPRGEVLETNKSFGYLHQDGGGLASTHAHAGLAWAMRRDAYEPMRGLPEFAIVGGGDTHFAYAMLQRVEVSVPEQAARCLSRGYWKKLNQLQWNLVGVQRMLAPEEPYGPGYVPLKVTRMWREADKLETCDLLKWQCLVVDDEAFDPCVHLKKDENGVLHLTDEKLSRSIEMFVSPGTVDAVKAPPRRSLQKNPNFHPIPYDAGDNESCELRSCASDSVKQRDGRDMGISDDTCIQDSYGEGAANPEEVILHEVWAS